MNEIKTRQVVVTLTKAELFQAAHAGVVMGVQAACAGLAGRFGLNQQRERWQRSIEGAIGEYAVASVLGVFWTGGRGIVGTADVGPVEVRATSCNGGHLIIHPDDDDAKAFILVTGSAPTVTLRGWRFAGECKDKEKYWRQLNPMRSDGKAYCVPQIDLHGMDTLAGRMWAP